MNRFKFGLSLMLLAGLWGGAAQAQLTGGSRGPIALNIYAGIGYDRFQNSLSTGSLTWTGGPSDRGAVAVGGDLGVQLTHAFGVVALAEFEPVFGDGNVNHFTVGGGIRLGGVSSPGVNVVLAAGYSRLITGNNGAADGFAVKGFLHVPIIFGFGPFLELSYHHFASNALGIFELNGADYSAHVGISYSY